MNIPSWILLLIVLTAAVMATITIVRRGVACGSDCGKDCGGCILTDTCKKKKS